MESAATSEYSKFILHYNFPPFSTGEVKMMRGPGRREVGHDRGNFLVPARALLYTRSYINQQSGLNNLFPATAVH